MNEIAFLTFLHLTGSSLLILAQPHVPRAHVAICAFPAGILMWTLAMIVELTMGNNPISAVAIVVAGVIALLAGTGRAREFLTYREMRWRLAVAAMFAGVTAVFYTLHAVVVSYDSISMIALGKALVGQGFLPATT